MNTAAPIFPGSVTVIPAVPPDAAEAYSSDDKAKWCEFIETHAGPLRADLLECLADSMVDPNTAVYRKGTPISGSLVTLRWFQLDTRHAFTEVLRNQLADTVTDGVPGHAAWHYDSIKTNFRASVQLFWEQASWVSLHLGTKCELDFPHRNTADGYFNIVDPHLADLMFERAFCQMCVEDDAPHHPALKSAYETKFGRTLDIKKLSGLERDLAKLTPDFVKTCTEFWKLGGYKH